MELSLALLIVVGLVGSGIVAALFETAIVLAKQWSARRHRTGQK